MSILTSWSIADFQENRTYNDCRTDVHDWIPYTQVLTTITSKELHSFGSVEEKPHVLVMIMRWYYVYELRPQTGLSPSDIWEWRTKVEWYRQRNLLIHPLELSGNPASSHLAENQEELGERNDKLRLRSIFVHISKRSFTCRKILLHGADGFTSAPNEGVLRIFIALAGYELANYG
jgi:hypothetical protein